MVSFTLAARPTQSIQSPFSWFRFAPQTKYNKGSVHFIAPSTDLQVFAAPTVSAFPRFPLFFAVLECNKVLDCLILLPPFFALCLRTGPKAVTWVRTEMAGRKHHDTKAIWESKGIRTLLHSRRTSLYSFGCEEIVQKAFSITFLYSKSTAL